MRITALLWLGVAVYFAVVASVYALVGGSAVGVTVLVVASGFGGLIGGWSWRWTGHHELRTSDRSDADVADATGAVGIYPSASLRPLGLAGGFTIALVGIALGSWMIVVGVAILGSQVGLLVRDRDG